MKILKTKSQIMPMIAILVCLIYTGCSGAVAGGGAIGKAISWLTFWKKEDSSMTDNQRIKGAFSEYVGVANMAVENARKGLKPNKKADTDDVEYIVKVDDFTFDVYDFFAVWLENYQKNNPKSDYSEIGNLVTVENLQEFFEKSYLQTKSKIDYFSNGGTVYLDEAATLDAAAVRAEKRKLRAEKQKKLDKLPVEKYNVDYTDNPDYQAAKDAYFSFKASYDAQTNSNAKSAMEGYLNQLYTAYMNEPEQLQNVSYTNNTKQIEQLKSEISTLDTEIANSKIKIITTVMVEKKPSVISDLGLNSENVTMISEMLKEVMK